MFIYLAGPYTHANKAIEHARFVVHEAAAVHMVQMGDTVISPIMHWHRAAREHNLPSTAEYWENYNRNLIRGCSLLRILDLPGLEHSKGTMMEMGWADEFKIPSQIYDASHLLVYKHFEKTLNG